MDKQTNEWTNKHTKIENPGVGRHLLGPAKVTEILQPYMKFNIHTGYRMTYTDMENVTTIATSSSVKFLNIRCFVVN